MCTSRTDRFVRNVENGTAARHGQRSPRYKRRLWRPPQSGVSYTDIGGQGWPNAPCRKHYNADCLRETSTKRPDVYGSRLCGRHRDMFAYKTHAVRENHDTIRDGRTCIMSCGRKNSSGRVTTTATVPERGPGQVHRSSCHRPPRLTCTQVHCYRRVTHAFSGRPTISCCVRTACITDEVYTDKITIMDRTRYRTREAC